VLALNLTRAMGTSSAGRQQRPGAATRDTGGGGYSQKMLSKTWHSAALCVG
jgi:hypothetical protein